MPTYDKTQSIDAFLRAVSARQPTPGGGGVAALAGALAAAMGEMVLNYSIGKKGLEAHQDELKAGLMELSRARQILLELMVEDQAAYATLTAVRKLPITDAGRAGTLDAALLVCIRIPQLIGGTGAAILGVCDRMVECANKSLLSDLAVCAELAMATVRCASHNVRVNLPDVPDMDERLSLDSAAMKQVLDAAKVVQQVIPRICTKLGQA